MEDVLRKKLIGEQLSSVEFVQDYLQIHFDGRNFIFYIWPIINWDSFSFEFGQPLYRDKLCELIGMTVKDISLKEKEGLDIIFNGINVFLKVNLDPNNADIVSEIALFNDTIDKSWAVFE